MSTLDFKPKRRSERALPPATVELEPGVDFTDWDSELEAEARRVRVGDVGPTTLREWLEFLAEGAHYDPEKHPRWPAHTPKSGNIGPGYYMKVGQRFSLHGVQYDVAAVMPGHLWAHVATLGKHMQGAKPQLVEISAKDLEQAERPPAVLLKGATRSHGSTLHTNATIVDAYVHPETHDPSIPIPEGSAITAEEWKRFGKADQEKYAQVQERYGPYVANTVQKKLDTAFHALGSSQQKLLDSGYTDQYVSQNAGFSLSLHKIWKGLSSLTQSKEDKLEETRQKFEDAKAAQNELTSILQWDLYNRTHSPDLAIFKGHNDEDFFANQVIKGGEPIYAGASFSQHFRPGFFGSSKIMTPMAIRNVAMSTVSGYATSYHAFAGEQEVAMADPWIADPKRSLSVRDGSSNYGSSASTHPPLTAMQASWLSKITVKGQGGHIIDELLQSYSDGGVNLPVPPAQPDIEMDGEGGMEFDEPPPEAREFGFVNGVKTPVSDMPYAQTTPDGKPIARKVKDMVQDEQLHAGDYIEGMKGTRYIVLPSPSDKYLGLVYYKITDTGTAVPNTEFSVPETQQDSSAFTGHKPFAGSEAWVFEGGGQKAFKKLAGHYDLPAWSEETTGFHPEAWAEGGKDDEKFLGKFVKGDKFILAGTPYEVVQPSEGMTGKVKIQNLNTAKFGKINPDYKSAPLFLKQGYTETGEATLDPSDFFQGDKKHHVELVKGAYTMIGQTVFRYDGYAPDDPSKVVLTHMSGTQVGLQAKVAPDGLGVELVAKPPGWEPPQKGDTFAFEGKKATVTKLLANGDVQVKTAAGSKKLKPTDPLLATLHRPSAWTVGDKAKLKDMAPGTRFHGGTGQAVRPYLVVSHEGTNVKVRNLDTGDEMVMSGRKSYARLVPVGKPSTLPPADHTTPSSPIATFDPSAWVHGPAKKLKELEVGDKFASPLGTPYEVVATSGYKGQEGLGEAKNLLTGVHGGYDKTKELQVDVATLVAKPQAAPSVTAVLDDATAAAAAQTLNVDDLQWKKNATAIAIKDLPLGTVGKGDALGSGWWQIVADNPGGKVTVKKVGPPGTSGIGHGQPLSGTWTPAQYALPVAAPSPAAVPESWLPEDYVETGEMVKVVDAKPGTMLMSAQYAGSIPTVMKVLAAAKQPDGSTQVTIQKHGDAPTVQTFASDADMKPLAVLKPIEAGAPGTPGVAPGLHPNTKKLGDLPVGTYVQDSKTPFADADVAQPAVWEITDQSGSQTKLKVVSPVLTTSGEHKAGTVGLGEETTFDKGMVFSFAATFEYVGFEETSLKVKDLAVGDQFSLGPNSDGTVWEVVPKAEYEASGQTHVLEPDEVPLKIIRGPHGGGDYSFNPGDWNHDGKLWVKPAVATQAPQKLELPSAPVSSTTFDPSAYTEQSFVGSPKESVPTLGQLEPGDVFKGKTGKYFQIKSKAKDGKHVNAVNLKTGKTSKLASSIQVAALLMQKAETDTPYEQLKPGDGTTLGKLKKGDQFTYAGPALFEVVDPSEGVDEKQVTIAAVAPDGSLAGHVGGMAPSGKVKLHAKAADTVKVPAAHAAAMEVMPDGLPTLGAGTFWDGTSEVPFQGVRADKAVAGFTFQDKLGVHYVVQKAGAQPVVLDEAGETYALDGNLYVQPVEDLELAQKVPHAGVTHQDVVGQLAAQGLQLNADKHTLWELGVKKGDTFSALGGGGKAWVVQEDPAYFDQPVQVYSPATGETGSYNMTTVPVAWKKGHGDDVVVEDEPGVSAVPTGAPTGGLENVLPLSQLAVGTEFTVDDAVTPLAGVVWKIKSKSPNAGKIVQGEVVKGAGDWSVGDPFAFDGSVVPKEISGAGMLSVDTPDIGAPDVPKPDLIPLPSGLSPDVADWTDVKKSTIGDLGPGSFFKTAKGSVFMVAGVGENGDETTITKIDGTDAGMTIAFAANVTPVTVVTPKGDFKWSFEKAGEQGQQGWQINKLPANELDIGDKFATSDPADADSTVWEVIGKGGPGNEDAHVTLKVVYSPSVSSVGIETSLDPAYVPSFVLKGSGASAYAPAKPNVGEPVSPQQVEVGDYVSMAWGPQQGNVFEVTAKAPDIGQQSMAVTLKNVATGVEGAGYYDSNDDSNWLLSAPSDTPAATEAPAVALPTPPLYDETPVGKPLKDYAVGDVVQDKRFHGGIYRIKEKPDGSLVYYHKVEVVKPGNNDQAPGEVKAIYGGGTFVPYKGGPMWKIGEFAKIVKPGNSTGKSAKVVGYEGDKYTVRFTDGKELDVPVGWMHGIMPQAQTFQKLAEDAVPIDQLKPGDVVANPMYGGAKYGHLNPYVVDSVAGGTVMAHPFGSPASSSELKKTMYSGGYHQEPVTEVRPIVTARQIAGVASSLPPPQEPSPPAGPKAVPIGSLPVGQTVEVIPLAAMFDPLTVTIVQQDGEHGFTYAKDAKKGQVLPFTPDVKVAPVTVHASAGAAPATTADPAWQPPKGLTVGDLKPGDRFVAKGGVFEKIAPDAEDHTVKVIVPLDAAVPVPAGETSTWNPDDVPEKVWVAATGGPELEPNTQELPLYALSAGTQFTFKEVDAPAGGSDAGVVWEIKKEYTQGDMSLGVDKVHVPPGVEDPGYSAFGASPYAVPATITPGTTGKTFEKMQIHLVEPGAHVEIGDLSGPFVPGVYEVLPQGYKPPPGADFEAPADIDFPQYVQNVNTGQIDWVDEGLPVKVVQLPGAQPAEGSGIDELPDKTPGALVKKASHLAPGDYYVTAVGNTYRIDAVEPPSPLGDVEVTQTLVHAANDMTAHVGEQYTSAIPDDAVEAWGYKYASPPPETPNGPIPEFTHQPFIENTTEKLWDLPSGTRVMFAPGGIVWEVLPWHQQSDESEDTYMKKISTLGGEVDDNHAFSPGGPPQFIAYPVGAGPDSPPAWTADWWDLPDDVPHAVPALAGVPDEPIVTIPEPGEDVIPEQLAPGDEFSTKEGSQFRVVKIEKNPDFTPTSAGVDYSMWVQVVVPGPKPLETGEELHWEAVNATLAKNAGWVFAAPSKPKAKLADTNVLNPYLWPKSGKKKYPKISTLAVGTKFRDKSGKQFTVASSVGDDWVHYTDASGTEYAAPGDSRVFVVE